MKMSCNRFLAVALVVGLGACGDDPGRPDVAGLGDDGALPSGAICEATEGTCFYLAPRPGSGAGTFDDPSGLDDLPSNETKYCELDSTAMEVLQPGDFLYFRGGKYDFSTCDGAYYYIGYIRPARSGEPERPITFSAYPGEVVHLTKIAGGQPPLGNQDHDYVRYVGFVVDQALGRFHGAGVELAYNEIRGTYVDTSVNHDGIRLESATGAWVHHSRIFGVTGKGENSAGIKLYTTTECIIEDNYIHDNTTGVYDKDSGIDNIYRRNYFTSNERQWYGNTQNREASPRIYENVIDGEVELHSRTNGAEVHDNLIRGTTLAGAWAGDTWNTKLWNNVVLSHEAAVTGYYEKGNSFTRSEPNPHLRYMDYNVYDAPPEYAFGEYSGSSTTFDLAQMQRLDYELHSVVDAGVYLDETSYRRASGWDTAGRDGDPVGPD